MKKAILILSFLCMMPMAIAAEHYQYQDYGYDPTDRNFRYDTDEDILRSIEQSPEYQQYVKNNGGAYQQTVQQTQSPGGTVNASTKTKGKRGSVRFKGTGSSPSQTQWHYGRPEYGYRGINGGGS